MSEMIMILGESGSGKSASLRNMPSENTFILQVTKKMLPFKEGGKKYKEITKENPDGNLYITDNHKSIINALKKVSENPKIKYIIVDDFQYTMLNSFVKKLRVKVSGGEAFEKYNDLAADYMDIIDLSLSLRDDLIVVLMSHCEFDDFGNIKIKTVGKLVSEKIKPEGKTSICLLANTEDGKYSFITNGIYPVKSPMGMFDEKEIDNDLYLVIKKIEEWKK
jgi:hypothetical protein